MRKEIAVLLGLVGFATNLNATTNIQIEIGPSNDHFVGEKVIPFSDLNGTALNGGDLSLNFSFSDDHFVSLFQEVAPLFLLGITLHTSATDFLPGLLGSSGYVTDSGGNPISFISSFSGSTMSEYGEALPLAGAIFPLISDNEGTLRT